MNANNIEHRIKEFIAREISVDVRRLTPDSDLCLNLGVDGDDAIDLMEKYSQEFGVDMHNFHIRKYFGTEANWFPFVIFLPAWWRWRKRRRPITITDLVRAAESGVWPSDEENSE